MYGADIRGETDHEAPENVPDMSALRTRLAWVLCGVLLVVLLAFVPPLINVSQLQRRIASNLSAALGRPVHLDRVSLSLLPLPGFTLENFVVSEDPAFGYEPLLRANEVRATVRLSSLWSKRVEFSRITLTEPTSLNLVRLPDGRWNFESVLLQASRIEAAPTAQTFSGPASRFPYIEATGARINLKLAQQKTPFALIDSEFSLWLPGSRQWRFRLQAHPARTDVAPSDAGLLRLEGVLGDGSARAPDIRQVPIDLHAYWDTAPLAGLSRMAFGRDIGLRGDVTLDLHALGTADHAKLAAHAKLAHARRAEFIPMHLVGLEASCQALIADHFQSFTDIQCRWPPAPGSPAPVILASGSVPDVRNPRSASATVELDALPAPVLLDWVQAATPHPPTALTGPGVLAGKLTWNPRGSPSWSGQLTLTGESLELPGSARSKEPTLAEILLSATPGQASQNGGRRRLLPLAPAALSAQNASFDLSPVSLPLGGRQPATLDGHFDDLGYTLHLSGSALPSRLLALTNSFPQFGEGLSPLIGSATAEPETPIRIDLTANRRWGQPQTWTDNAETLHAPKHAATPPGNE